MSSLSTLPLYERVASEYQGQRMGDCEAANPEASRQSTTILSTGCSYQCSSKYLSDQRKKLPFCHLLIDTSFRSLPEACLGSLHFPPRSETLHTIHYLIWLSFLPNVRRTIYLFLLKFGASMLPALTNRQMSGSHLYSTKVEHLGADCHFPCLSSPPTLAEVSILIG